MQRQNSKRPNQNLPLSHAPIMPRFIQQALTSGFIVLLGDGLQTRDFVYVDDVSLISALPKQLNTNANGL